MFRRNEEKEIKEVSRPFFISFVIYLCKLYDITLDNILIVVEAADRFVSGHKKLVYTPRFFSIELAYTLVILSEKLTSEESSFNIKDIGDELGNNIAILEREIYQDIDFLFQRRNVFSLINIFYYQTRSPLPIHSDESDESNESVVLNEPDVFYDIIFKIANNKSLMYANPNTLLLAMVILMRKNKLKIQKAPVVMKIKY
jgi:hypothetical protein